MTISNRDDLKLKLGNLVLAAFLSIVPTTMTIGLLGAHGMIVCRDLSNRIENVQTLESCDQSNRDLLTKYTIWIWLIITFPTWRWFYIGHYRRIQNKKNTV